MIGSVYRIGGERFFISRVCIITSYEVKKLNKLSLDNNEVTINHFLFKIWHNRKIIYPTAKVLVLNRFTTNTDKIDFFLLKDIQKKDIYYLWFEDFYGKSKFIQQAQLDILETLDYQAKQLERNS